MKDKSCVGVGILIGVGALMLMVAGGWYFSPDLTDAATDTVLLNADITDSVSCSSLPTQTGFETLTTAAVHTATSTATTTVSCNHSGGVTLYVKDAGDTANPGLYSSGASDIIVSSQATLEANTEGYGIQAATTTAGTGDALLIDAAYKYTGNEVGALALGNQTITSSDAPLSGKLTVVTFKAAIGGLTKSGNYVDTVTFECTGN